MQITRALTTGEHPTTVKTVLTLTASNQVATVNTTTPHGFRNDDLVTISGSTLPEYNGRFKITVVDPTTFTYSDKNMSDGSALGTIKATRDLMQLCDRAALTCDTQGRLRVALTGGGGSGGTPALLTPATALALGGVKAGGDNIVIHPDGVIDALIPGALTFKGTADLTVAQNTGYVPKTGDTWVVTTAGAAHSDWNGLTTLVKDSLVIYDGTKWDIAGDLGTNVKPDWDAVAGTAAEILNKPTGILKYWGVADTGTAIATSYTASAGGHVPAAGDAWQTSNDGTADPSWTGLATTHPNDLVVFDGANWKILSRLGGSTRYYGTSTIPSGDPNDGTGTGATKTPVIGAAGDAVLTDKALWKWSATSGAWVKSFDLAGSGGALPSRNWTFGASVTTAAATPLTFPKTFQPGAAPYACAVYLPTGGDLGNVQVKNSDGEIVASARGVTGAFTRLDVEPDSILPNGRLTIETTKSGTFDFTVAALVKNAALPPGTPPPPNAPPPTAADAVPYDNTVSALAGTDVQAAVDELAARKPDWNAAAGAANEILNKPAAVKPDWDAKLGAADEILNKPTTIDGGTWT